YCSWLQNLVEVYRHLTGMSFSIVEREHFPKPCKGVNSDWEVMFRREDKCTVFKFVQDNLRVFGHTAFRKNNDVLTVAHLFGGAAVHISAAFRTFPVYQDGNTLI